ncbi:MAG: TonB-dependent receptor [Bacteroidota bacterium]
MKTIKKLLILILFLGAVSMNAQNLTISGTVQLPDRSEAIGAVVELEGTDYRTVTEADGTYTLKRVKPAKYTLLVSYLGTETFQQELDLSNGKNVTIDVDLEEASEMLDQVMVTGKSAAREQQDQAIQIESVDVSAVSNRVKDLSQAIDQLAGVRVRTSGSLGDRVDVSLNGLNGTAVRTYIDGLPLEFVYPSLNIGNVPLNNVKRVDVYKGVLPVNVGTDAMGGGINLITDYKPYNSVQASYSYGSFNTHQAGLNINLALKEDVIFTINTAYNYADNDYEMEAFIWEERELGIVRRFHDAYELFLVDAALVIQNKPWADRLRISANYADFYKEIQNGGLVERLAYGEAAFSGISQNIFLEYEKNLGDKITLNNFLALTYENLVFQDTTFNDYSWSGEIVNRGQAGEFGGPTLSDRDQNGLINRTSLSYQLSPNDQIILSNLYARQKIDGRDIIQPLEQDVLTQPQYLTKDILGLEYNRKLFNQKLDLAVAGKLYYYGLEGVDGRAFTPVEESNTTSGYYASLKYSIKPSFFIRGSFEKAWRIPTFGQFFGDGANIIANIDLQPESSDNFNLGVSFQPQNQRENLRYGLEVNGFLRGQNDIIFLSPNIIQQYINAEEVRSIGAEVEVFVDFLKHFRFTANATRLNKTYESIDESNINSQFLVGTNFPNTPTLFANARLTYRVQNLFQEGDGLQVYGQYKYVDEFNFINVGQVRNDDNWVPIQQKVDAGFSYSFPERKIILSFNVNNVLDDEIFDNFRIPRPGRNYNVKVNYQISNF